MVLDLRPLLLQVEGAAAGLGVSDRLPALPPNAGHITILESDQLSAMQTVVHGLKVAANFLVILVVLVFAAAVWVAPDRRRGVRACAIALLVAGLVLIFLRRVLGDALIEQLVVDDTVRPAAHEGWWIATDPLRLITTSDRLRRPRRAVRRLGRGPRQARGHDPALDRARTCESRGWPSAGSR